MRRALSVGVATLVFAVCAQAAPQISRENGVYVLENSLLRAEVKTTELYRLTYKPTGQELMSPSYHGVIYIDSRAEYVPQNKVHYLIQDSFQSNRAYETEVGETEATLTVNFDWGWAPEQPSRPYAVKEQITIFANKPYLRVRYYVSVREKPVPVPGGFSVGCQGLRATHLVEPNGQLRVEQLGDARMSGMRADPNSYWFAYWDQPSGHFTAFVRPGQTNPTRCIFTKGRCTVTGWSGPFLDAPGQSHSEELWLVAGQSDEGLPTQIAQAAEEAYEFVKAHQPILATLASPYVTHEELVKQTAHLRADGKGDHIVFKNERLYVDGKPFLLFAPWGGVGVEHAALCRKYHLNGLFYGPGYLKIAADNDMMCVAAALEWPAYRGEELQRHINSIKDHPALLAWFLQDDFGGDLKMLENIEIIRKCETHIPTLVDTVGYDAGRRRSSAFVDIQAPYAYPVARRHTYRWYADYLDHNQKIMDRQFNWTCPEVFGLTAAMIRLETYIGLAHGIRGFMYWPGGALLDHRLAELGIVCLEVEPLTELIVEAQKVPDGAATDNQQIEAQRIDWGEHTLLFFVNYRDKSVRWPTGELAPKFTVTVNGLSGVRAYSMTFDKDLQIGLPRQLGENLQFEVSGLDIGAMVLLTPDGAYARRLQSELVQREAEAVEFATTTNKYTVGKAYEILYKLGRMRAPLGRAAQLYNEAVARLESEATLTGQRRVARLLRQSLAEALAQADALAGYAPLYARESLLRRADKLPQFMASFNFRALKEEAPPVLSTAPSVAPMAPLQEPPKLTPLEVETTLGGSEGRGSDGYVAALQARTAYCLFQTNGRRVHLYADEDAYIAGQTASRAPPACNDFVDVPNDNQALTAFLIRPAEDIQLYITVPQAREALGITRVRALESGEEVSGPALSIQSPVAVYELPAAKGDSFEVTVRPAPGCTFDAKLCQVFSRYAQVLASARISGQEGQSVRCTLTDDAPLAVLIERYSGDGDFTVSAEALAEKVVPQLTVSPFAGVKFGLYGKEPAAFTPHLAAHGISGDHLDGQLAATDLSEYDVIILLTNAIKYDEIGELKASAEELRRFVHSGGRMVLFQQNGGDSWDSSFLPYDMKLKMGAFFDAPVLADEKLLYGFMAADFPREGCKVAFYPIDVRASDDRWGYLAYTGEAQDEGLVAVCDYGSGRVILNQFAVLDRIGEPVMRSLMVETIRYVLEGD